MFRALAPRQNESIEGTQNISVTFISTSRRSIVLYNNVIHFLESKLTQAVFYLDHHFIADT